MLARRKNGNFPLFCIEKDTRGGVLYAPFACVLLAQEEGFEPPCLLGKRFSRHINLSEIKEI